MANNLQNIRTYFLQLGFSAEVANIYLALYAHGKQTISELARTSGVERTRIYRLMNELEASNLIEIESQYKRHIFSAAPISNLQVLLSQKEQELHELQAGLGDLQEAFPLNSLQSAATKIQVYKGTDSLKQMFWNQTHSTTENLSILYENMQSHTQLAFFERWVKAVNARNMKARSIISDKFMQSQRDWYKKHTNQRLSNWEGRYISGDIFPITHSTVIYNDTTSYFNWKDGEIFGIEIHNQEIADAQRQFFEMLWAQGMSINDLEFRLQDDEEKLDTSL